MPPLNPEPAEETLKSGKSEAEAKPTEKKAAALPTIPPPPPPPAEDPRVPTHERLLQLREYALAIRSKDPLVQFALTMERWTRIEAKLDQLLELATGPTKK